MVNESRRISKQPFFWILVVICLVLFFVVIALFVKVKSNPRIEREAPMPVPSIAPFVEQTITEEEIIALEKEALSPAGVDTSDWPTYTNKKYGFSFKYPEGMYIQGMTGFDWTNPEYASYLFLSVKFENETAKYARLFMNIKAEALDQDKNKCVSESRLPLEQFVQRLRELNVQNNKEHAKWNNATVSEVIPLTSGKEKGYMLTFDELAYDGCVSKGLYGLRGKPFEVQRYYEDGNIRIQTKDLYEQAQMENPLYQVIMDTLEFNEVLQEKSQ